MTGFLYLRLNVPGLDGAPAAPRPSVVQLTMLWNPAASWFELSSKTARFFILGLLTGEGTTLLEVDMGPAGALPIPRHSQSSRDD